jgi:hypothetical protein
MLYGKPVHPIGKNPGRRGDKQHIDPILGPTRETLLLEKVQDIVPCHRVEGLKVVKLKKQGRRLVLVNTFSEVIYIEKVVWMLLFFMKSLWALETSSFINIPRRMESILVTILAMP